MRRARNGRTKNGTRRIAGSRNRLTRNGLTESGLSGPPRLNRTMATLRCGIGRKVTKPLPPSSAAHELHQLRDVLRTRLRHDAVAQVEDVRPPADSLQHGSRLRLERRPAR